MEPTTVYDLLAGLVQYPGEDYRLRVERCAEAVAAVEPEAASPLMELTRHLGPLSSEEIQELYTRTFDLDPHTSLEVGWHLFGEAYDRGTFLVKMRQEIRRHALVETGELPDHLTHVLGVLARMTPDAADEFAAACVLPALAKMRAGLDGKADPFDAVLQAIQRLLQSRHGRVPLDDPPESPALSGRNGRGL